MIIDFNDRESTSIKSFTVKKKGEIKVTTRFMSGKLLMLAKLSLKSFIYSLVETLYFPNATIKEIYKKYDIERILCYRVLTDTGSTSIQFIATSDPNSSYEESKMRDVLFEVIVKTDIYKRFDTSHPFWDNFNPRKPKRQKKLGLYEVERVDNPCYVTLAVNSKEYFEFFQNYSTNKEHKDIKKGSRGMEISNYANRIKSLVNFDTFEKPPSEYKDVARFIIKKGDMVKTVVNQTKFSQVNDMTFYFPDGILSLPYGHQVLSEIDEFKRQKGQNIEKYFWEEKDKLLQMEKKL